MLCELKELVWRGRDIHLVVQRARIVLYAHEGRGTEEIGRAIGWTGRAVRKWKARFEGSPSLETLKDAARSGRPSTVPLAIRCQLVRLACERPNHEIMRFRDVWTYASLSDVLAAKTGYRLSTSEIGRILRFKVIRPHHIAQWLHSEDPDFLPKAKAVCDLYLHPPRGRSWCASTKSRCKLWNGGTPLTCLATTEPSDTSTSTSGTAPRCCWRLSM